MKKFKNAIRWIFFKKVIGWILIANILPIIGGLCTLNGKFCYHGSCQGVIPFWGGYFIIMSLVILGGVIIFVFNLVLKYLIYPS